MNQPRSAKSLFLKQITVALGLLAVPIGTAQAQIKPETLETPAGQRVTGRLVGDPGAGCVFQPADANAPLRLEPGTVVHFSDAGPNPLASAPPFRVLVGEVMRLSGTVRGVTANSVRFAAGWQSGEVTIARPGVQAIVQRAGEVRVIVDGFETLERSRWITSGKPENVENPRLSDRHSLRLPGDGASLLHRLEEPLATGRLDLAFLDDGAVAAGHQWSIELTFNGPSGASVVRTALGWTEESLAVESLNGPSLAVQRLARSPGWHRFSVRFGPEQTEISVDGKELAHGKGPDGPLTAIRLASAGPSQAAAGKALAGHVDELQLIRFAEPPASLEIDISQDEARLVVGDQLYGAIRQADGRHVEMTVDGEPIALPWGTLAGVYFRRVPATGKAVQGLLVRVEWRSAAGENDDDVDFAEGAIVDLSEARLTLATPYSSDLKIPRDQIRKLLVRGQGARIVIDPAAHHLGDEISQSAPVLDPPVPEGGSLERTLELRTVPREPAALVLDVIEVVSETANAEFSDKVRAGEFRTYVLINGRRIDYLNHFVKTSNKTVERIAVPIPEGVLRAGKNTIQFELTPDAEKHKALDDLGILQIAVEFGTVAPRAPAEPEPGPP
jgi:hypothetical protein